MINQIVRNSNDTTVEGKYITNLNLLCINWMESEIYDVKKCITSTNINNRKYWNRWWNLGPTRPVQFAVTSALGNQNGLDNTQYPIPLLDAISVKFAGGSIFSRLDHLDA